MNSDEKCSYSLCSEAEALSILDKTKKRSTIKRRDILRATPEPATFPGGWPCYAQMIASAGFAEPSLGNSIVAHLPASMRGCDRMPAEPVGLQIEKMQFGGGAQVANVFSQLQEGSFIVNQSLAGSRRQIISAF